MVHALQTAWWAITRAPETADARQLPAALELAVRAGGDTDTTAAIAGALLGARWGASAVPAAWCRPLHGWPGLTADDLTRLAVLTATGGAHAAAPVTVNAAAELARSAHAGQIDKAGAPYIDHPARVAARVRAAGDGDDAEIVAWLHDVVEDTDVTLLDIEGEFGPRIARAVDAMTRRPGEGDGYYERVAADPLALAVKRHDIADNTDSERTALLDPATRERLAAKYRHARQVLDESSR